MPSPNEKELIGEINNLEKQNEDMTKKLDNKKAEAGGKGKLLNVANTEVYFLKRRINVMRRIIIEAKDETMIRKLAKEENTVPVSYNAFEGTYMNKKDIESKCYYSADGKYCGAVKKNTVPPILKFYIVYKEDEWKWNDEGYLYYDGEGTVEYKNETTPITMSKME